MKYIKKYENIEQELQEIPTNTLYKYANSGYVAIGKIKKNEDPRTEYKIALYDFIDNRDHSIDSPNYKIIPNREMGITSHKHIIGDYLNFASPDEIEIYNTLTNINKYNL